MHYISSQQSKSNILKERKKIKRKRVRETKEVREYGYSIIEKKRKINLMRNTYIKKGEWNTKEGKKKKEATDKRGMEVEMVIEKQRDVERVKLRKKFRNKKTEIDMEKDRDRQTDRQTDR